MFSSGAMKNIQIEVYQLFNPVFLNLCETAAC